MSAREEIRGVVLKSPLVSVRRLALVCCASEDQHPHVSTSSRGAGEQVLFAVEFSLHWCWIHHVCSSSLCNSFASCMYSLCRIQVFKVPLSGVLYLFPGRVLAI